MHLFWLKELDRSGKSELLRDDKFDEYFEDPCEDDKWLSVSSVLEKVIKGWGMLERRL